MGPIATALADTGHRKAVPRGGYTIKITYPRTSTAVANGAQLTPTQTASQPRVHVDGPGPFTLIMVDPDAPSPDAPLARSWLHWIVANAKPGDVGKGNGDVIAPYNGPTPPKGTHRYVFLVYAQPGGKAVKAAAVDQRARFNAGDWVRRHLGAAAGDAPDAVAYFLAAPEG